MSSSRQAYVLPSDSIADTTRRLCYGKIRRENTALLRTIEGLNEEEEIRKRRHRDEKSNLQQIIYHLNYQREGKGENLNWHGLGQFLKPNGVRPAITGVIFKRLSST